MLFVKGKHNNICTLVSRNNNSVTTKETTHVGGFMDNHFDLITPKMHFFLPNEKGFKRLALRRETIIS